MAADRYARLHARNPRSVRALVGLGRVALAQDDVEAARIRFEQALRVQPGSVAARLGLADTVADDPEAVRAHLAQALADRPDDPGAHARFARVTGRAPGPAASTDEAILLADRHPYDPNALLDAGRRLAAEGRTGEAIPRLEAVLALADLEPAAADDAVALLREVSPDWAGRRVLPVHVYVDAALRRSPSWRFRQRRLWSDLSKALDPLVATRFLVVSFTPFDGAPPKTPLDAWLVAFERTTAAQGRAGLFAGFTAEPTPSRPGAKRGVARYLGRHLVVRDAPSEQAGRVLAHELMHIWGGIHVVDDLDSLMNPSGNSRRVDPLNAAIVRSLAARSFLPGGVERNVLSGVDLSAVSEAFTRALQVNLAFRETGLSDLLGDASQIGPGAQAEVRRITQIDTHLGDVSRFVSRVYWASGRRVEAVAMLELAAQLFGTKSPEGRATLARARVLRSRLKAELGVE